MRKKAYITIKDFKIEAIKILNEASIEVHISNESSPPNTDKIKSILQQYDILIIEPKVKISKEILNSIKEPKIIATSSVGIDHIDKEVIQSSLVTVLNLENSNSLSVAEHIFALILALNKRICEANNLVLIQKADKKNLHEIPEDISNKTLGLIGAGNIAKEVIKIAKAFTMKIVCYTKNPSKHTDLLTDNVEFLTLDEVLKESDIVSISIPLTDETKNFISAEKIALLKNTATFINTSRTTIVDVESLISKLSNNPTFYAGLDIDVGEYDNLFLESRNNLIVTPHIAGTSKQAITKMDLDLAKKIISQIKL